MKKILSNLQFTDKKVLLRLDFNVPFENGEITDDKRIRATLETIKYLQERNAKVIILSHLGRVKTEADLAKNSLAKVAVRLGELLGQDITFVPTTRGHDLEKAIGEMQNRDLLLMENTRYEDLNGQKESSNDPELGKYWASLGDVFVNDAFGTAHRAHASNVGIAENIKESCIGFLIEKELTMLSKITKDPVRPFVAVLGGAKVSDKIDVIKELLKKADTVIVGGGMAYTFMKALGKTIGTSLVENEKLDLAKTLITEGKDKLILPVDFIVTPEFKNMSGENTTDQNIKADKMGMDIGKRTQELFKNTLKGAKTVFWNGPLGVFEMSNFETGTKTVCEAIGALHGTFSLIGGGDSAAAAAKFHYEDKFSFISTGGGASLEYVEGKKLPGIEAIQNQ